MNLKKVFLNLHCLLMNSILGKLIKRTVSLLKLNLKYRLRHYVEQTPHSDCDMHKCY